MTLALATTTEQTLEQLVDELIAAKAVETKANNDRIAIEKKLIDMLPAKEEGASTTQLSNGLKVTITGKLS
jgi:hypothetical protein